MGARGPVGKRSDQRLGHRAKSDADKVTHSAAAPTVPVPPANDEWHPVAKAWYEALALSGQARFYEPSDWATAALVAESMSRDLRPQFVGLAYTDKDQQEPVYESMPLKGASLSAYLRAMTNLLATEGDRRRMSIELERAKPSDVGEEHADATVTDLLSRIGG